MFFSWDTVYLAVANDQGFSFLIVSLHGETERFSDVKSTNWHFPLRPTWGNAVVRDINEASFFRLSALFIICFVAKNVSRDCARCTSVTVHNGCYVTNVSYTERLHPRTRLTAYSVNKSNKCWTNMNDFVTATLYYKVPVISIGATLQKCFSGCLQTHTIRYRPRPASFYCYFSDSVSKIPPQQRATRNSRNYPVRQAGLSIQLQKTSITWWFIDICQQSIFLLWSTQRVSLFWLQTAN